MAEMVQLRAKDGHVLDAYVVQPGVPAKGGLVIVQEIYGVNAHIRAVADRFADEDGFVVVAPALFDRIERGVDLGYEAEDTKRAMSLLKSFDIDTGVEDIAAAVQCERCFRNVKKIGVLGYCLGGTLAWLSAARLPIHAAVGYYGGKIAQYVTEKPKVPVMLHFGELDQHIPREEIDAVAKAHPSVQIFTYPSGHAFNRDGGPSYSPSCAMRARERTRNFLHQQLS
jgi:carboxymethylenebutenolidase